MNILPTALAISGIGIIVLLLVLTALAGIVYLMTRFIVDKEENEEETTVEAVSAATAEDNEPKSDLKLAVALAVAIARAQADTQVAYHETSAAGDYNAWRQNGLLRRLNQSSMIRRTR